MNPNLVGFFPSPSFLVVSLTPAPVCLEVFRHRRYTHVYSTSTQKSSRS
jgi:hypothetical protein